MKMRNIVTDSVLCGLSGGWSSPSLRCRSCSPCGFFLAWSSGARAWIFVALVSGACLTCCFWSGAHLQPAVPILRGRDGARAHFATIRSERAAQEGRRKGKSQLPFSFLSFGFCVNACGKAPVGNKIELCKCCRVSRSRDKSSMCYWCN